MGGLSPQMDMLSPPPASSLFPCAEVRRTWGSNGRNDQKPRVIIRTLGLRKKRYATPWEETQPCGGEICILSVLTEESFRVIFNKKGARVVMQAQQPVSAECLELQESGSAPTGRDLSCVGE